MHLESKWRIIMKKLVILGAGTGGTMMANKLAKDLDQAEWLITVVDQNNEHHYQPGYLFVPFDMYKPEDIVKPRTQYLTKDVQFIQQKIERIEPENNFVFLEGGVRLDYDFLIIATGAGIVPTETEGLLDDGWYKKAFDFYTLEGAEKLRDHVKNFNSGRLVINMVEMPIKCPVAPLEFAFLADWYFRKKGIRKNIEIELVTPLDGAFTKPVAASKLSHLLGEKEILTTTDFAAGQVDYEHNKLISYDNRSVNFDLLVTVPTNMGASCIGDSGLGNELNYVPTDLKTLRAKSFDNIFVIGDATDLPSSKAGSVVHFQSEVLAKNFLSVIEGKELKEFFDGHANCYVETGFGKGLLIDFNYDTEPLSGKYPLPIIGPFSLLEQSRINHWGKLFFKWIYFNMLLKGYKLPVPNHMSMVGKKVEKVSLS